MLKNEIYGWLIGAWAILLPPYGHFFSWKQFDKEGSFVLSYLISNKKAGLM